MIRHTGFKAMLVCSRPQNQMVIYQWENKNWGRQKYETTSPPGIIIRRRGRKEKRGWVSGRQLWAVCQTIPLFFCLFRVLVIMYVNWQFLYDSLALKTHDTHTQLLSLTISISTWRVCWWRGWGRRSRRASCQCLNGAAPPSCGIPVLEFERERKRKRKKELESTT